MPKDIEGYLNQKELFYEHGTSNLQILYFFTF